VAERAISPPSPPAELAAAARPFIERAGLPVPGDGRVAGEALATSPGAARRRSVDVVEQARLLTSDSRPTSRRIAPPRRSSLTPEIAPALASLRDALATAIRGRSSPSRSSGTSVGQIEARLLDDVDERLRALLDGRAPSPATRVAGDRSPARSMNGRARELRGRRRWR